MTNQELREAREALELSQSQMAAFLCVGKMGYCRWEADDDKEYSRPVPPLVAKVVRWLLEIPGFVPPDWPKK